jgi:hypothetical protein
VLEPALRAFLCGVVPYLAGRRRRPHFLELFLITCLKYAPGSTNIKTRVFVQACVETLLLIIGITVDIIRIHKGKNVKVTLE